MANPVDQVLSRRAQRPARSVEAASLGAAFLLHLLVVAAALLLPRLQPPPQDLEFVPVQIIPAAALGVRRPAAPRARPTPPAAEPAPAPPEPEPDPEPVPPRPQAPVLPRETEKKPEKKPERKPETAPRATPGEAPRRPAPTPPDRPGTSPAPSSRGTTGRPEDSGDQAGRRGAPTGSAVGTTAFGSEIGGVDNPDFKFGYYLDQLLARIDQNWARPSLGDNLEATIVFRIHQNGSITDLKVEESSGFAAFDLAATRAVSNAAPFPPLPRAYRHDSLGVTLIVR